MQNTEQFYNTFYLIYPNDDRTEWNRCRLLLESIIQGNVKIAQYILQELKYDISRFKRLCIPSAPTMWDWIIDKIPNEEQLSNFR